MAPAVPRKVETLKETTQGGRAGARGTTEESTETQNPFLLCVFTFAWGYHTESPENSLWEVSQVSLQLAAEGRGLLKDRYQFWGWPRNPLE